MSASPETSERDAADGQPSTTSLFSVPGMDCPSEERLIRMALDGTPGLVSVACDLGRREVRVLHSGSVEAVATRLAGSGLEARLVRTGWTVREDDTAANPRPGDEGRTLRWLLAINGTMFVVEILTGWLAQSTGLIADALDMFADAAVYGLALFAVGRADADKRRSARLSGWLQLLLAVGAMTDVLRRLLFGSDPDPPLMAGIALVALAANVTCMALLARHRTGGVHMQASWIFSTNDVLANIGVILAGVLVAVTGSNLPDLIVGAAISLLVLNGARRIMKLTEAAGY